MAIGVIHHIQPRRPLSMYTSLSGGEDTGPVFLAAPSSASPATLISLRLPNIMRLLPDLCLPSCLYLPIYLVTRICWPYLYLTLGPVFLPFSSLQNLFLTVIGVMVAGDGHLKPVERGLEVVAVYKSCS